MILSWDMAERLQCGEKEKQGALDIISALVEASEKARREGLLALEDDIEEYRHPLLRLGMSLVVDGTDPKIIREILEARILSENRRGGEFLEQILIYQGCLSIQAGDNPRVLTTRLFAFLGEEGDRLKDDYYQNTFVVKQKEHLEQFVRGSTYFPEIASELGSILEYNDSAVQKILREIDMNTLGKILLGADSDVRRKIVQNMSEEAAFLLVEEVYQIPLVKSDVRENCEKFWNLLETLKEQGEI